MIDGKDNTSRDRSRNFFRLLFARVFSVCLSLSCLKNSSLFAAPPPPASQMQRPLTSATAKAKQAFAAGRYDLAIQFAADAYNKNPASRSNLLLMARSYYRLGDLLRAAQLFQGVQLAEISSDTALEYTIAMFMTKHYRQASVGWTRIPGKHPQGHLTRFYSGVSYLYLQQYSRASKLLRSATRLPPHLRAERRRLLDQVDAQVAQNRRGQVGTPQTYAYQPMQRYSSPPPTTGQAATDIPKPAPPAVGWAFTATPTFTYESTSIRTDFNGYKESNEDIKIPTAILPMLVKYSGSPRSFGGQPYVSLALTPGYSDTDYTASKSSLTASEDQPDLVSSNTEVATSRSFKQTLVGVVEGLYPLHESVDILANYKQDHSYVDGKSEKDFIVSGPLAKLTLEFGSYKIDGSYSLYDTEDHALPSKGSPAKVKSESTFSGVVTRSGVSTVTKLTVTSTETDATTKTGIQSFLNVHGDIDRTVGDFSLGLGVDYATREPYPGSVVRQRDVVRPKSDQTADIRVTWSAPFSLSLTGGVSYTMFEGLEYMTTPTDEVASSFYASDGTVTAYTMVLAAPIFGSYGGLDFSYKFADRVINPPGEASEETKLAILKNFWSQATTTTVKLTLKYPL